MKRFGRRCVIALYPAVFFALLAAGAAAGEERLFLWRLTSPEGGRAYLAGSMHLAVPGLYPLPAAFERAFAEADRLAVELDTETLPAATVNDFIARKGLAAPGRVLDDYLTPATRQALARDPLNRPEYARYRPWLAALSFQMAALEKNGFSAAHGLDKYFLGRAAARRMPVLELETFQEQMSLLAEMSDREADFFLRAAILEADAIPEVMADFQRFWLEGDLRAFAELFFRDYRRYPELSGLMEGLINRRNRLMAERLRPLLAGRGRTTFVLVGAGHLVGEEGLPALLAAQNFRVEQMTASGGVAP